MDGTQPLAEPPKGVLVGEDVPIENQETDFEESMIQDAIGIMRTKEAYRGKSDSEIREIAKEKYY